MALAEPPAGGAGLHLPGGAQPALRWAVAIDASGSCRLHLAAFTTEVRVALAAGAGRVLVFDATVHTDVVLAANDAETADRLPLRGGDGTAFRPALDAPTAPDPPDGLVALTNGLGCVPPTPPGFPVLWVLTPAGQPTAAWAQSVSLPARR